MKYVYKKSDTPTQQRVRAAQAGPRPATGPVDELEAILEEYCGKADAARAEAQAAREKADTLRAAQVEAERERCLEMFPKEAGTQAGETAAASAGETKLSATTWRDGAPGVLLDDGADAPAEALPEALLDDLTALPGDGAQAEPIAAVAAAGEPEPEPEILVDVQSTVPETVAEAQAEPMVALAAAEEPEPEPEILVDVQSTAQETVAEAQAEPPREKIGSPLWTEHVKRAMRRNAPKAAVALSTAAVLLLCLFMGLFWQDSLVITDSDGMRKEFLMRSDSETDALDFAAPLAGPNDVLTYRRLAPRRAEVKIARAFPVALRADGKTHFIKTVGGSVSDLLADCGVTVSGEDFVVPAADTVLEHGTYAAVHRVTYEEEEARKEISDEEVAAYKKDYEAKHKGEPFPESNAGLYDAQLRHRLVDGVVESTEVLSLTRVIVPRPADSYAFTPGIPQSRIVGYDDIEMDENGFPVNYTRVWQGAVCTAYSSSGGRGSSGLGLYCGTAAVNPNVIPYGTRMFITDASGYYVYGFCIATDTGTAMMEGYVDIDLYFEDNAECYAFGKRAMTVYFFD